MTTENPTTGSADPRTDDMETATRSSLRGRLGVGAIVLMVIAASAPLTVVAGASPIALALGNGPGLPAAYVVVAVVLLLFSVGYAAMSQHVTNAGAFYAYISRGLGRPWGLGASFLALLSYTCIQVAIYGLFGASLGGLLEKHGFPAWPWWVWSLLALIVVGLLGFFNIELGAKVLGVLLACEVAIIVLLDVFVLAKGGAEGIEFSSFTPSAFFSGSPGIALMFAVASFVGFEATAIYGEEARDPRRTVPLATYVAVIVIGIFYALSIWVVVLAYGSDNIVSVAQSPDGAGLVFAAGAEYIGAWAADAIEILLVTSLFAVLLAFHNAIGRYLFSLGRDGALPAVVGRAHPKHGSPYIASLIQGASAFLIVAVFVIFDADPVLNLFGWMSGVAVLGILILMALTCISVILYFRRTRTDTRPWQTMIAPALGLAGLVFILYLVVDNFPTLIGGSTALAVTFEVLVVAVFVAGVLLAFVLRGASRDRYDKIGHGNYRG